MTAGKTATAHATRKPGQHCLWPLTVRKKRHYPKTELHNDERLASICCLGHGPTTPQLGKHCSVGLLTRPPPCARREAAGECSNWVMLLPFHVALLLCHWLLVLTAALFLCHLLTTHTDQTRPPLQGITAAR